MKPDSHQLQIKEQGLIGLCNSKAQGEGLGMAGSWTPRPQGFVFLHREALSSLFTSTALF